MTDACKEEILRLTATATTEAEESAEDNDVQETQGQPSSNSIPIVHAEIVHDDEDTNTAIVDSERGPLILFVDDVPEHNAREIYHFKNKGYSVITTTSTSSAMTLLQNGTKPDIIVSDMGRREDAGRVYGYSQTAGLLLISEIRNRGQSTPIVIYTVEDNVRRYETEANALGGNGMARTKKDLYELVESLVPIVPTVVAQIEE